MLPLKFGWPQGTITINIFVEIGTVEYRTLSHLPFCSKFVSDFFLCEDFQSPHAILPTFHHRDGEINRCVGEVLGIRYERQLDEAT
jgi:hypothetical protein